MTPEQLKQTGEALIALSEGKQIQWIDEHGTWIDFEPTGCSLAAMCSLSSSWRIKPTLKKRLIRPDELPDLFWIRMKNYGSLWKRPVSISCEVRADGGFAIGYLTDERTPSQEWIQVVIFQFENPTSIKHWEWSPYRKTVHSFFVEGEE
jgi:hypothetical protein